MLGRIRSFLGRVPGARRLRLNWREVGRAALAGCGAGSPVALALAILRAVADHADAITTDPIGHAAVIGAAAAAIDLVRRLFHDDAPTPP